LTKLAAIAAGFVAGSLLVAARRGARLAFSHKWRGRLFGVGIVHGKDLEHGSKEFKGWPREKKNEFIGRLLVPIKKMSYMDRSLL
jgi:hypothetical protein